MSVVHSGEVRGEVGMRSRMCYVGWVLVSHVFLFGHIWGYLQGKAPQRIYYKKKFEPIQKFKIITFKGKGKGKVIPLQAQCGPEGG